MVASIRNSRQMRRAKPMPMPTPGGKTATSPVTPVDGAVRGSGIISPTPTSRKPRATIGLSPRSTAKVVKKRVSAKRGK